MMSNPARSLKPQLEAVLETITNIQRQHSPISRDDARAIVALVDRLVEVTGQIRETLESLDQLDRGEFLDIDDVIEEAKRIIAGKEK